MNQDSLSHATTVVRYITKKLIHGHKEQKTSDAWHLLQAITNQTKANLLTKQHLVLAPYKQTKLAHWIDEINDTQKPFAYILGSIPFCNLKIHTKPPILIPRSETEQWCAHLIETLAAYRNKNLTILDIGTGSGSIALALAKSFPHAQVYGVDCVQQALTLSDKNKKQNNIDNALFMHSDLYAALPKNMHFDIIVSNPPYISIDAYKNLDHSVRRWEDKRALVSDENGYACIKKIINNGHKWLKANSILSIDMPRLVIEIGHQQKDLVNSFFVHAGFTSVKTFYDVHGYARVMYGYMIEKQNEDNLSTTR